MPTARVPVIRAGICAAAGILRRDTQSPGRRKRDKLERTYAKGVGSFSYCRKFYITGRIFFFDIEYILKLKEYSYANHNISMEGKS